MIDVVYEYVDIPDDPAPSRERTLSLPPMDDDVGGLRAIPDPEGKPFNRSDVLILGTDVGVRTQSLGAPSQPCGASATHYNRCDDDFLPQTSYSMCIPDLTPDSSPTSMGCSTMLMTPENGISLADIETSPFLPLIESYFEDIVFGDGHCMDHTAPYFDSLEDSLSFEIAGDPFLEAIPGGTACQSPDENVHSSPTLHTDLPASDLVPQCLAVPEFSKMQAQLVSPPRGVETSGTRPLTQRPLSRSRSASPATPVNEVQGSIDSSVTSTGEELVTGSQSSQENNDESIEKSPPLRSPSPCSILAKRRRVLETGDGDDDDDDYIPTTRWVHPRVPSNSQMLSNKGDQRTKRRGARKSRSYLKSASKSRSRCPHCRTSFSRAGDVDRHQKSLACPVLKRKAEVDGTLDEARWPCPICGDKLSRNDSQARHFENTHPGVSPSDYGLRLRKRDGKL